MAENFFELVYDTAGTSSKLSDAWLDASTADEYSFSCGSTNFRLRKRTAYPQTYAYTEGSVLHFGYGAPEDESIIAPEFLFGKLDTRTGQLTVQRDTHVVLPIFYGKVGNRTALGNNFEFVCKKLEKKGSLHASTDALINFVLLCDYADHMTLVREVGILNERQQLKVDASGLHVTYPKSWEPTAAMVECTGNPHHFKYMLERVLDAYWQRYGGDHAAFEFSGGLDSATMPGYLTAAGHAKGLLLGTIMFPFDFFDTQAQKLKDFQQRFDTSHIVVSATTAKHAPLRRAVKPNKPYPLYQYESAFAEAFDDLGDRFAAKDIQTVFAGIGGDEVLGHCNLYYEAESLKKRVVGALKNEIPSYVSADFIDMCHKQAYSYPEAPLPLSPRLKACLDGPLSASLTYVNRGIWQVNPLADAGLYQYCQSLPSKYKDNKRMLRAFQAAWKFPESIYRPHVNEDFEPFFLAAFDKVTKPVLLDALPGSPLVEAGIIDAAELKRQLLASDNLGMTQKNELFTRAYYLFSIDTSIRALKLET